MNAILVLASRSGRDWQAATRPFAHDNAECACVSRARLYKEVQS